MTRTQAILTALSICSMIAQVSSKGIPDTLSNILSDPSTFSLSAIAMDPQTIAKIFSSFSGMYCVACLLAPEKSTKMFGYKLDMLSQLYCAYILSAALACSTVAFFVFFEKAEPLSAIAYGFIPMVLQHLRTLLNWDLHDDLKGRYTKTIIQLWLTVIVFNIIAVYIQVSWARLSMSCLLYTALVDGIVGMLSSPTSVRHYCGEKASIDPYILAMQRNFSPVILQLITFDLMLLNGMKSERAYGCSMLVATSCMIYKRILHKDENTVGFSKAGTTFWFVSYSIMIANLLA